MSPYYADDSVTIPVSADPDDLTRDDALALGYELLGAPKLAAERRARLEDGAA